MVLMPTLRWSLAFFLVAVSAAAEDWYFTQRLLITEERFQDDALIETAGSILSKHASDFILVEILPEKDRRLVPYPNPVHRSFAVWRSLLERQMLEQARRRAEIISIGPDSLLRITHRDRRVREVLLRGSNPLDLQPSGGRVEILHFSVTPRGPATGIRAYAKSSGMPTIAQAKEVLGMLSARWPGAEIGVSLADNEWFVDDSGFPIDFAFRRSRVFPSRDEYFSFVTVTCGYTSFKDLHCNEYRK